MNFDSGYFDEVKNNSCIYCGEYKCKKKHKKEKAKQEAEDKIEFEKLTHEITVRTQFSGKDINTIANAIRESTSDEMIAYLKDLSNEEVVELAIKQIKPLDIISLFPRRVKNLKKEKTKEELFIEFTNS